MQHTKVTAVIMGLLLTASTALAANVVPTVKTFTVPTSAVSPIPVSAFTATDTDGTVTGYMITESSTKPTATATGWSATPLTSYTTAKTGVVTLYAWAKDNAAGVSASKTATTTIVSGHTHNESDVVGLTASLAAKADISALATKADASALAGKSDITHNHDTIYQKKYASIIVVAQNGGDFTDPISALNSIVGASATNPYLVKIMPGTYDVGQNMVLMKEFVDIEGSGESVTRIYGNIPSSYPPYFGGVLKGASNSELRNITVENYGIGGDIFTAIFNENSSPKMQHVTALVASGRHSWGIVNSNAAPLMENITAKVSGTGQPCGIYNWAANPIIKNFTSTATGGSISYGMITTMTYGTATSSPILINGELSASGSQDAYGAFFGGGSPELRNLTISASGSANSRGLSIMSTSTASVNFAMYNSTVTSSFNGIESNGNRPEFPGTIKIYNSSITAPMKSIFADSTVSTFVSNTQLSGGSLAVVGALKCINVFGANFDPMVCQ